MMFACLNVIGGEKRHVEKFIAHTSLFEVLVQDYMRRNNCRVQMEAFDTIRLLMQVCEEHGIEGLLRNTERIQ